MARGGIEIEGLDGLTRTMARLAKEAPESLMAALRVEVEAAFERSQQRVPRQTGALASSGRITEDMTEIDITYGDSTAWYAAIVHEDLTARHHDGQSAKFLELAVDEITAG